MVPAHATLAAVLHQAVCRFLTNVGAVVSLNSGSIKVKPDVRHIYVNYFGVRNQYGDNIN